MQCYSLSIVELAKSKDCILTLVLNRGTWIVQLEQRVNTPNSESSGHGPVERDDVAVKNELRRVVCDCNFLALQDAGFLLTFCGKQTSRSVL